MKLQPPMLFVLAGSTDQLNQMNQMQDVTRQGLSLAKKRQVSISRPSRLTPFLAPAR